MKYILASASPRRRELMEQAGFQFDIIPSPAEENREGDSPEDVVMNLASQKAYAVGREHISPDQVIIGADTLVVYNGEILGKPSDHQEAYDMLSMLSDRTHQVYTGVCLLITRKGSIKTVRFCERTDVTFYPISREDLLSYTATGDSLDKAGAYGIQGPFAVHVKSIQGDYNNVVGLPLARLYHELLNEGLEI